MDILISSAQDPDSLDPQQFDIFADPGPRGKLSTKNCKKENLLISNPKAELLIKEEKTKFKILLMFKKICKSWKKCSWPRSGSIIFQGASRIWIHPNQNEMNPTHCLKVWFVWFSEYSWSEINKVCTVCNLLHLVVSKYPDLIQPQVWDLITCSLVSWVGTLQESKDSLTSRYYRRLYSETH